MYKIVRYYANAYPNHRTIQTGLTLEEAQEHCENADSSSATCTSKTGRARTRKLGPWFDGYTKVK